MSYIWLKQMILIKITKRMAGAVFQPMRDVLLLYLLARGRSTTDCAFGAQGKTEKNKTGLHPLRDAQGELKINIKQSGAGAPRKRCFHR
ncbi:MAG: hypothetical protein Q7T74_07135 [Candidatus Saccharibacteria bacterium]|nr:hypothetical protein [Candidatus Saccharibacteria bacterium]